jgi:hypothetical protein
MPYKNIITAVFLRDCTQYVLKMSQTRLTFYQITYQHIHIYQKGQLGHAEMYGDLLERLQNEKF